MKVPLVNFVGGEPLLRPEIVLGLLHRFHEVFYFGISTNGLVRLSYEVLNKLSGYTNLDIRVSIHGVNPDTHDTITGVRGSHVTAWAFVDDLLRVGKRPSINCVLTALNKHEVLLLQEKAWTLGLSFGLLDLLPNGRGRARSDLLCSPEDRKEIHTELHKRRLVGQQVSFVDRYKEYVTPNRQPVTSVKQYSCKIGENLLEILPNGDAYPCSMALGDASLRLGSVSERSLQELWDSPVMEQFRMFHHGELTGVCRHCQRVAECGGGCLLRAHYVAGSLRAGDPYCPLINP
jgi:radical SAM protein with 4Fe4S-binding SPASM domain